MSEKIERLKSQLRFEIDQAEDYLSEKIRPKIVENWEYYRGDKPFHDKNEASFVSNDAADVVDHYVANCVDAFNSDDTLEIRPRGVTDPFTIKVINQVVNEVLNVKNNRYNLYQAFFTDAMVSCASLFKPERVVEVDIDNEYFTKLNKEDLDVRIEALEASGEYDKIVVEIYEEETQELQSVTEVNPDSLLSGIVGELEEVEVFVEITLVTGKIKKFKDVPTIKIEQIPAENFIINKDAKSIKDAKIVGHKSMVTISQLMKDFDYDRVKEVFEKGDGENSAETNEASVARARKFTDLSGGDTYVDNAMMEVELFEIYIRSSFEDDDEDDDEIHEAKLYRVFYSNCVILEYEEVDFIPYAGSSVLPNPFMFWGDGMVDRVKHIQRATSGMVRQDMTYNELVNKPRFQYVRENIVNPQDIVNPKAGAGIAVKQINNAIAPIQTMARSSDNMAMIGYMQQRRESATGMSTTGQGLMGEALKAGASTISAQMVLTEDQMLRKSVIKTLLENGIKPLIRNVYELLRDEFNEWPVTVDNQTMVINPSEWPSIDEIRVVTPLGSSAKLEKAAALEGEYNRMATAQGEAAKLFKPEGMRGVLTEIYELRDIPQVSSWLASPQEIAMKDQMMQMMQQLQQQLGQMGEQLQIMTAENAQLKQLTTEMAQKELAIKERNQERLELETDAKIEKMAEDTIMEEQKLEAKVEVDLSKQALEEEKFVQYQVMADAEAKAGVSLYKSV